MTNILLACAAGLTLAWLVAAQRRLVAYAARRFLRLPRLQQVALVLVVGVMTVCAQKQGTGNKEQEQVTGNKEQGTSVVAEAFCSDCAAESGVENSALVPCSLFRVPCSLTTNDIARGYALVEVRTNETVSYEMPTNGVEVGTWGKTGAYRDVVRVRLSTDCTDCHGFVWGDEVVTSLWAHTWGKVRPRIRDRAHEIVAVGTPMSCVPGEGRLWMAATTNGTFLLTWENFVVGRVRREIIATDYTNYHGLEEEVKSVDGSQFVQSVKSVAQTNATLSAQIEFFPNGDFITRSNNVERVYRRVDPDDWDDDGIENEEDDEPMVAADETQFGPNQTLPDGANSNAYCWVDLVVPRTNAKVTFVGDGASNLADPSFIAKAGETNRVILLIGKSYRATCPFPLEVVAKSSEEIVESWNGENEVALCWPVAISVAADGDAASDAQAAAVRQMQIVDSNNGTLLATPLLASAATAAVTSDSFSMVVIPSGLGGAFDWTNYCCSITGSDYAFELACEGNCGCGGCTADGRFVYEGYSIESPWGPSCGCSNHDEDNDSPSRGVSAYFTKNVIIFEDEYDNSPTEHVGWRSTETVLKCSANGGANGGLVRIEVEGADSLVQYNGKPLPYLKFLEPNETISFKNTYRAVKESNAENDIKVTATFVENETGWTQEKTDEATAVKVRITPEVEAPKNDCAGRHLYGVREEVRCRYDPSSAPVSWRVKSGCRMNGEIFTCPLDAATNPLSITGGTATYTPNVSVIEPSGIESRNAEVELYGVPTNHAGGIGMRLEFYALPLEVSFENVSIEEVPCLEGTHSGYFAFSNFSSEWSHTVDRGAGRWMDVELGNFVGIDNPALRGELPRITEDGIFIDDDSYGWIDGELIWNVPFGWNESGTSDGTAEHKKFGLDIKQQMVIFETGRSGVRKLKNMVYRDIDGTVNLNGRIVHED